MSAMKDYKSVATWISLGDFELLQLLAEKDNVTIASYIRGIIVDAIQDQGNCISNTNSIQLDLALNK